MALLKHKIKCSTLPEVITALAIVLIIFAITFTLVGRLTTENSVQLRYRSYFEMSKLKDEIRRAGIVPDDTIINGAYYITTVYKENRLNNMLETVTLTSYSIKGNELGNIHFIIEKEKQK